MKTAIALLAGALLFGAGCTTPQQTVAYKTLATVSYSVDSAMKTFATAHVERLTSPDQDMEVRELHEKYQRVMNAAVRAARYDYSVAAPEDVAAIAAELTALIFSITQI